MFGLLASGRLVNTNVQDGGGNLYYFTLDHIEGINHIVVFLTGDVPFSDGFGGSVFLGWPSPAEGAISWQLLGFISNQKPSAIFKISNIKPTVSEANPFGAMVTDISGLSSTTVLLGVSVETLDQIAQQTPANNTQASTVDSFTEFSQKMLRSFLNYASSFAVTPVMMSQMPINPMDSYVPLNAVQNWYDTFLRRLTADPNYWKNL